MKKDYKLWAESALQGMKNAYVKVEDCYDALADKHSQISSKRTQRKFTFNLLSAAEIHRIILLRQHPTPAPCG